MQLAYWQKNWWGRDLAIFIRVGILRTFIRPFLWCNKPRRTSELRRGASRCSGPASGRRGMGRVACGRDHRARTCCSKLWSGRRRCRAPAALETPARGRSSGTELHGGRVGGRARRNPPQADFGCRFAPRCQLGCLGKPPSRSRKCLHRMGRSRMPSAARVCASVTNRPMRIRCSRTRCRGAGSRAGEVCHPAERSVGRRRSP